MAAMMLALPAVSLGLRTVGYVRLHRWIERMSPSSHNATAGREDIANGERLARLAGIAGRHGPMKETCLRQSLLLYALLRRNGCAPQLMIGANRESGRFTAHAWVELGGVALGQSTMAHIAFPGQKFRNGTA